MKSVILAAVVSFLVNIVGRKILVIECEVLFYRSNKYKCRAVVIIISRKTAICPIMMLLNRNETNTGMPPMVIGV